MRFIRLQLGNLCHVFVFLFHIVPCADICNQEKLRGSPTVLDCLSGKLILTRIHRAMCLPGQ